MYFWNVQNNRQYNLREVIERIKSFCAIQDRSHYEVKKKMKDWGVEKNIIDNVLSDLITEKFVDEHRFVDSFCRGKFRIKKWGKIKIKNELKKRKISEPCINKGLEQIDEKEYRSLLSKLFEKKKNSINEKNKFIRNGKIAKYLQHKGFENNLIWELINNDK